MGQPEVRIVVESVGGREGRESKGHVSHASTREPAEHPASSGDVDQAEEGSEQDETI